MPEIMFILLIQALKEIFAKDVEGFSKDAVKQELASLDNNQELKTLFGQIRFE